MLRGFSGPLGRLRFARGVGSLPVEPGDTLVHGASLVIAALNSTPLSGMGTKAWSQPAWDAVEGGTPGTRFHDADQLWPNWRSFGATASKYSYPACEQIYPSPTTYHPLYDTEHVRGGAHCTRAVKQHYYSDLVDGGTAVNLQGSNYITCADLPATPELYCTFWRYFAIPEGKISVVNPTGDLALGSRNWKHCNAGNSSDFGGAGFPQQRYDVYPCNANYGGSHQELNFAGAAGGSGGEVAQTYGPHLVTDIIDQNVWQRFEMLTRHGTVANKDWCFGHWKDGVLLNWADPTTNPLQADQPVFDPADGRPYRALSINFFCSPSNGVVLVDYPRVYGIIPNFGADFWLDDLYLDCSRARIELGNAATWAACTHREIQPWTAWADGSVTVTVNHGTLPHGTQYLYAVKPDGTPFDANGHPVTLG
jgi:hypothetical protein